LLSLLYQQVGKHVSRKRNTKSKIYSNIEKFAKHAVWMKSEVLVSSNHHFKSHQFLFQDVPKTRLTNLWRKLSN